MSDKLYSIDRIVASNVSTAALIPELIEVGALVEVIPCEHWNYAPHIVQGAAIPGDIESDWCDGKPKEDT